MTVARVTRVTGSCTIPGITCTVDLMSGYREEGHPCAGDLTIIMFTSPRVISGPPSWFPFPEHNGFWKIVGPEELNPTFVAFGMDTWEYEIMTFTNVAVSVGE